MEFQIARWAMNEISSRSHCHNRKRSSEGLVYCERWERDGKDLIEYQEGNEFMKIAQDLIDCQVGSRKILYCQVGKGEQMNSEVSSYQQEEMTEKEDQKSIMMIGGIKVFLPHSLVEASVCVSNAATTERQPAVTVKEMEQMSEASQGEEEEHIVKMLTPWEKELEMLEDWLNNPEPVDDCQSRQSCRC
jgi:hypothetical protein